MSVMSHGVLVIFNDAAGFNFPSLTAAQQFWEEVEQYMIIKGYDLQYFNAEYLDTVDREDLMESLGQLLIGKSWPSFGDSEEVTKAFYAEFNAAARKRGIEVVK